MNTKAKSDQGKPKLSLVPIKIIFAIEKIRSYGNAKYPEGGKDNWKTVEPERHFEAMLRHAAKCWNDPYAIDPESGLPHMFHMACDMAFFIEQNWDEFERARINNAVGTKLIKEIESAELAAQGLMWRGDQK